MIHTIEDTTPMTVSVPYRAASLIVTQTVEVLSLQLSQPPYNLHH